MSLVSTWVRMKDGKWYQNPTMYDDNWYICFDDDDPPELVMTIGNKPNTQARRDAMALLNGIGIKFELYPGNGMRSQRLFPPKYKIFKHAISFFFKMKSAPDLANLKFKADSVKEELPETECVFYKWKE